MHTATGIGLGNNQGPSPLQDALSAESVPGAIGGGGGAAAILTDSVANYKFSRSSQETAPAPAPAPAQRSLGERICSSISNFFKRNVAVAGPASLSSSEGPATNEASEPQSSRNTSGVRTGFFKSFRSSAAASSDGEETSAPAKEQSHREKLNAAKKTYNAAIDAAIEDINNLSDPLKEPHEYLDKVNPMFYSEARTVIGEALTRAEDVRFKSSSLHRTVVENELDNIGNSLRGTKKETEFGFNLFDISKAIGDFASYDVGGFFDRHLKVKIDGLDGSFTECGVFKKIAQLAFYTPDDFKPLKTLNAYIHDTKNPKIIRFFATIVAAVAAVALNIISFLGRASVLALAASIQLLIYKKILPALVVLGGIAAALVFAGKAAVAAGIVATLAYACCMTGVGTTLISTAANFYSHYKLKRELSANQDRRHEEVIRQLQAQLAQADAERKLAEAREQALATQLAAAARADQGVDN